MKARQETMIRTPQEIEELKAQWIKDGCWDIEDTQGFEAHHEELFFWRMDYEKKQRAATRVKRLKAIFPKLRRWILFRWRCETGQCDYYAHYLAYGPAELTHIGFHSAERLSQIHMRRCAAGMRTTVCHICLDWEKRLRA